ncbi:MAG: glycosyltransferase, partial [Candidatus Omnitrophica bacterium]|nr:glycosyltransferase [Candidatus Omnitrophota bacterium]
MRPLTVAVVVPAFNASLTLPQCLQALLTQTRSPDQIIVVDDGSTDHTADVVAAFGGVVYIRQENAGPACARNRGEREAVADVVLFTDSDCEPVPDWVETTLAGFQREGVGVVSGSYAIRNPASRLARCIHEEIAYRHQHLMPAFPRSFGSYNFAVLRDVFAQVGGFDESYRTASGEDNDLSYKIRTAGYKIYFERNSKVAHVHPERVFKYLREQFRHGFWRVKMYRDHPHMAGGDDYTFWKDIWEIGLAGAIGLGVVLAVLG